jgi:hypothetical protein
MAFTVPVFFLIPWGCFVTKVAGTQRPRDASSMGRNVLGAHYLGGVMSQGFFKGRKIRGRKVQGRNVMVPANIGEVFIVVN